MNTQIDEVSPQTFDLTSAMLRGPDLLPNLPYNFIHESEN